MPEVWACPYHGDGLLYLSKAEVLLAVVMVGGDLSWSNNRHAAVADIASVKK